MKTYLTLIFLLFVGCSTEPVPMYDFELETGLVQDENAFYHLSMNPEGQSDQVLHKFSVNTNNPNIQLVHWVSDTFYEMDYFGNGELVPIINGSSYSYEDGMAYTMFGPHMSQVGDTVSILVGYTDSHTYETYTLNFEVILD